MAYHIYARKKGESEFRNVKTITQEEKEAYAIQRTGRYCVGVLCKGSI